MFSPARRILDPRRAWVGLLLGLWLFAQSWAWAHRVEHGSLIGHASPVAAAASPAAHDGPHAGLTCEWLDHALLGSGPTPVAWAAGLLTPSHAAPVCTSAPSAATRLLGSYQARAPPAPERFLAGRVTG